MSPEVDIAHLAEIARKVRAETLRMIASCRSGHPSGSLSVADIMTALYFHVLNVDPARPDWPQRDRFILGKGHACPSLYAALALRGFFPREELKTLRQPGSKLQGHPDHKTCPGVDMTTGSLGQGLSVAVGMALAARLRKVSYRVYCLISDGEQAEGQVWEAAMAAAHYRLSHLICLVDDNGFQSDGRTLEVLDTSPLIDKWRAFGWNAERCDGHSLEELTRKLAAFQDNPGPSVLLCSTRIGKGVSFLEDRPEVYGRQFDESYLNNALSELYGSPTGQARSKHGSI